MKRRVLSLLLALAMVVGMLPMTALEANAATEPVITQQPQNPEYPEYSLAEYSVTVYGENLTCTWYMHFEGKEYNISDTSVGVQPWEPYAGETYGARSQKNGNSTTFTYRFDGIGKELDGSYVYAKIEDGHFEITSDKAHIIVTDGTAQPPKINVPAGMTVSKGEVLDLYCSATAPGDAKLTYLWHETSTGRLEDIIAINRGAETGDTLRCDTSTAGTRYYVCWVGTSDGGSAYSSVIPVTVEAPTPAFTKQPTSGTVAYADEKYNTSWQTNFIPVKLVLYTYDAATSAVVSTTLPDPKAVSLDLDYLATPKSCYWLRAYYSETEYVASSNIYITVNPLEYVSVEITEPVAGQHPDFNATLPEDAAYTQLLRDYELETMWWDATARKGLAEGDIFIAGHSYIVKVTLQAKDGYAFPQDNEKVHGTLNGEAVTVSRYANDHGKLVYVSKTYIAVDMDAPITGITIDPSSGEISQGDFQRFEALVSGTGYFCEDVIWSVSGGTNSTIDQTGLLTVGLGETAKTLTVTATSVADSTVKTTATVTVKQNPAFTKQPVGGSVVSGEKLTVTWETNFTPVKQAIMVPAIVNKRPGFRLVAIDKSFTEYKLAASTIGPYKIVVYYSDTEYITSDAFYVTAKTAGTPVIFTDDTKAELNYSASVDIEAMAEADENLMEAYFNDKVSYQWYCDGKAIPGATGQSIPFGRSDVGKEFYVVVTYGNYASISATLTVERAPGLWVGGVEMLDGDYLAVGETTTTTMEPSGGYAYYENGVLTLNNYSYTGAGYFYANADYAVIFAEKELQIVLKGENVLNQTTTYAEGICLAIGSLMIYGSGSLTVTAGGHGIQSCQGSVTINNCTINVTAGHTGITASTYATIDANVTVSADRFGIAADSGVEINGGVVDVRSLNTSFDEDYWAIRYDDTKSFAVAAGLTIQTATMPSGMIYASYDVQSHKYYDRIVVGAPIAGVWVSGIGMFDGEYLAVGATATTTAKPTGGYAYYNNGVLTLNNYTHTVDGSSVVDYEYIIHSEKDLKIVLEGTNELVQKNGGYFWAIHVVGNLVMEEGETGYLETNTYTSVYTDGVLTINSGEYKFNECSEGMNAKEIAINGGKITITSNGVGIFAEQNLTITDGTVTVTAVEYGMTSLYSNVIISGGVVDVKSTNTSYDETFFAVSFGSGKSLTIATGMTIQASTESDGTLGNYVAANYKTYDRIVVSEPVPDVRVGGVDMFDGDYLAVGATTTTTTKPSGGYAYYNDGVLTLHNYSFTGEGYEYFRQETYRQCAHIFGEIDLKIVLEGDNSLTHNGTSDGYGIHTQNNSITIVGDDDASLKLDKMVTGIVSVRGKVVVSDCELIINASRKGIQAWNYLTGNDGIDIELTRVNATIVADDTGLYGDGGDTIITDSTVNITSGSGIGAKDDIMISGCEMIINAVTRGIRGDNAVINNSNVTVKTTGSPDDWTSAVGSDLTIGTGLTVQASTEPDGTLGTYDPEKQYTYDYIVIQKQSTALLGDVNLDGKVDFSDLQRLYQHLSTDNKLTGEALAVADVNKDGKIDFSDLQRLYQHLSTDNKLS